MRLPGHLGRLHLADRRFHFRTDVAVVRRRPLHAELQRIAGLDIDSPTLGEVMGDGRKDRLARRFLVILRHLERKRVLLERGETLRQGDLEDKRARTVITVVVGNRDDVVGRSLDAVAPGEVGVVIRRNVIAGVPVLGGDVEGIFHIKSDVNLHVVRRAKRALDGNLHLADILAHRPFALQLALLRVRKTDFTRLPELMSDRP